MSSETNTPGIIYHAVAQRSPEWRDLRRLGGSQAGEACGYSKFRSPAAFVLTFRDPFDGNVYTDHGTAKEPLTDKFFRDWLKSDQVLPAFLTVHKRPYLKTIGSWKDQSATESPGYLRLDPTKAHAHFNTVRDHEWFGASLDYEGSVIDAEYKNPYTFRSFRNYYVQRISPSYFAQLQWLMAMRQRRDMFFVATSYTNNTKEPILLGCVIWYVRFSEAFFKTLYERAVISAMAIYQPSDENMSKVLNIPWEYNMRDYESSDEYEDYMRTCVARVHHFEDLRAVAKHA